MCLTYLSKTSKTIRTIFYTVRVKNRFWKTLRKLSERFLPPCRKQFLIFKFEGLFEKFTPPLDEELSGPDNPANVPKRSEPPPPSESSPPPCKQFQCFFFNFHVYLVLPRLMMNLTDRLVRQLRRKYRNRLHHRRHHRHPVTAKIVYFLQSRPWNFFTPLDEELKGPISPAIAPNMSEPPPPPSSSPPPCNSKRAFEVT